MCQGYTVYMHNTHARMHIQSDTHRRVDERTAIHVFFICAALSVTRSIERARFRVRIGDSARGGPASTKLITSPIVAPHQRISCRIVRLVPPGVLEGRKSKSRLGVHETRWCCAHILIHQHALFPVAPSRALPTVVFQGNAGPRIATKVCFGMCKQLRSYKQCCD